MKSLLTLVKHGNSSFKGDATEVFMDSNAMQSQKCFIPEVTKLNAIHQKNKVGYFLNGDKKNIWNEISR
jgi:hypothetical protein